jgi:uncharacterized protein (TIGR03437 family)
MTYMKKAILCLAAIASTALGQTQTATFSYSGLPVPIPAQSSNSYAAVRVLVTKSLVISSVTASVQVSYNGVGDLNVFLYSPAATRTKLLEKNCGTLVNIDTTFADAPAATTKYNSFCPAEAGRGPFQGNEPLANSQGQNSLGYWLLAVQNNGSGNTGVVTGFSVTITGVLAGPPVIVPQTVVSTASLKGGAVSPGETVSVYGANLGPATPVSAGSGNLPTSLAGTTVLFNGTTVPIFSVSNQMVNIQTPTDLSPGATANIQVMSTFGASGTVSLPVVPAMPGVFTYESGGGGQARAINQDGSINGNGSATPSGTDKPAAAGTIIQLFATGLGALDPSISTGTPSPSSPLSVATLPITATIAGLPAVVTYAGAAPTLIGIYQVNVRIPANAPKGAAGLVLNAGGNVSQDGVTIAIQ